MKEDLVNDVVISGSGFSLGLTVGSLKHASELVGKLFELREHCHDKPFALFDDDSHLAGFVIPSKINSIVIQSRSQITFDLQKAHFEMLKAQTAFYKSHTIGPDF